MIKQYEDYYTYIIEIKDFDKFGIYKQHESVLVRQIGLEQEILDKGKIDAVDMDELLSRGYLFVSDAGLIINNWEDFIFIM